MTPWPQRIRHIKPGKTASDQQIDADALALIIADVIAAGGARERRARARGARLLLLSSFCELLVGTDKACAVLTVAQVTTIPFFAIICAQIATATTSVPLDPVADVPTAGTRCVFFAA